MRLIELDDRDRNHDRRFMVFLLGMFAAYTSWGEQWSREDPPATGFNGHGRAAVGANDTFCEHFLYSQGFEYRMPRVRCLLF